MGKHKENVSAEDSIEQLKVCSARLLVAKTTNYLIKTNMRVVLVRRHSSLQCGHEHC